MDVPISLNAGILKMKSEFRAKPGDNTSVLFITFGTSLTRDLLSFIPFLEKKMLKMGKIKYNKNRRCGGKS